MLMGIIAIMFCVALVHWALHMTLAWFFAREVALCMPVPYAGNVLQIILSNIQVIDVRAPILCLQYAHVMS